MKKNETAPQKDKTQPENIPDDVSDALECPITLEIMDDPLTLSSGIVYDRKALTSYVSIIDQTRSLIEQARFPCPVSRKLIDRNELQNGTTLLIKQFIEDYIATNEQTGKGLAVKKRDIKPWFICPISREMMDEPVTVSSGATYDRKALTGYFLKYNNSQNIQCLITGNLINRHELENGTAVVIKKFIKKIDIDPDEIKRIGATFVLPNKSQIVLAQFVLAVGNAFTSSTRRARKPMSIVFIMMVVMVAIAQLMSKSELIPNHLNALQTSFKPNTPSELPFFSDFQKKNDLFFRIVEKKDITQYDLDYLNVLIRKEINIEARNNHWETPLIIAARRGEPKLVEMLLLHGANVNALGRFGESAMFAAVKSGQLEIIDSLLKDGADIEAWNSNGQTVLRRAAIDNNVEVIDKLLASGANINGQGADGWTPLMAAAYTCSEKATERLLAAGANTEIRDNAGKTALMHGSGYQDIVYLLKNFHLKSLPHASSADDEATWQEKLQAIALSNGRFTLEDIDKMSSSALLQLTQPACLQALKNGDTRIELLAEMTASELEDANAVGQYPNADSPKLG